MKKPRFNKKNVTFALMALPGTLLYAVLFIFPILWGIYYSFTDYNGISQKYQFVGLKNYIDAFRDARFTGSIWFNVRYSVVLVLAVVCISLSLALLLNRKLRCKGFFRGMYFFPAVLSLLTVGLIFNEIFARVFPYIGEALHIEWLATNLLSNKKTAIWGILLVNIWQSVAIPTVLFLAGLQTVPSDLQEAAALDGASKFQQFRYITMPFLLPILTIVLVLVLKEGLMVFDYIMAMTGGGPARSTESMAMLIYSHGFLERRFSYAIAESIIMAAIMCTISFFQVRWSNKKQVY